MEEDLYSLWSDILIDPPDFIPEVEMLKRSSSPLLDETKDPLLSAARCSSPPLSPEKPRKRRALSPERAPKRSKLYQEAQPFMDPELEKNRLNAINAKRNRDRIKKERYRMREEISLLSSENRELKMRLEALLSLVSKSHCADTLIRDPEE